MIKLWVLLICCLLGISAHAQNVSKPTPSGFYAALFNLMRQIDVVPICRKVNVMPPRFDLIFLPASMPREHFGWSNREQPTAAERAFVRQISVKGACVEIQKVDGTTRWELELSDGEQPLWIPDQTKQ